MPQTRRIYSSRDRLQQPVKHNPKLNYSLPLSKISPPAPFVKEKMSPWGLCIGDISGLRSIRADIPYREGLGLGYDTCWGWAYGRAAAENKSDSSDPSEPESHESDPYRKYKGGLSL